jgi:hypothetical protein
VAETAGLPLVSVVCRCFDPSRSRVRFTGIGGETDAVAALRGNKSSRFLPRPGGAYIRRQRRACEGGAPRLELLYRRCLPATRRPAWEVSSWAICRVEDEAATDLVEGW